MTKFTTLPARVEHNYDDAVKAQVMTVTGSLFALRLTKDNLVGLYNDNDGTYLYDCSFHLHWVPDLQKLLCLLPVK
jgi:hypothetical protein